MTDDATPSGNDSPETTTAPSPTAGAETASIGEIGTFPVQGISADVPLVESPQPEPVKARESDGCFLGVGRRKSAVARVRIRKGEGRFLINGREINEFFCNEEARIHASAALTETKRERDYDVLVRVNGGGTSGQSGAILMGTARALLNADAALEETLRREGYLTRDARMKERKKYGRRGARRSFQFSKR